MRRAALAPAVAALLVAACLDDSPVTAGARTVRATLSANVVGASAGGTIRIRVGYRTSRQALVPLPSSPEQITLAAGTTVVLPLTVDIGPCLADRERQIGEAPGCRLTIELTLADASGGIVDTQTREADGPATPGQSVDFGAVTIGVVVSSITLAPTSVSLNVGQEQQVTATVRDIAGAIVTTLPVSWTTTDATVATLGTTSGQSTAVRAVKLGTTAVSASAGGKSSAPLTVNVVPPTPLTIRQRPAAGCVIVGQSVTLEVDTPPGAVTWSTSNAAVATIAAATGVVTGVAAGTASVTATSGNRSGTASICVIAMRATLDNATIVAGRTAQITVSGVNGGTVSFQSSAPGIATVDANGLIRGLTVGQTTVRVTLTGASGTESVSFPITVNAGSVAVSPASGSAPINGIARFTAVVRDADGVALPGVAATWSINDASIGSLSATLGVTVDVRATKVGVTTIRALVGGATASAVFTATEPLPAARLEKVSGDGGVCPTRSTSCTFVVRAVDVNGLPVAGASVSWSTNFACASGPTTLTDAAGLASAVNICSAVPPGAYTQTATLDNNQQQVIFSYALNGMVLSVASSDSNSTTLSVTSSTGTATGLVASVKYRSGPTVGYITGTQLNRTSTPALLILFLNTRQLPPGNYAFDVTVTTTTPGLGPAVQTYAFTIFQGGFIQPLVEQREPGDATLHVQRVAPPLREPPTRR